jgi:hypothetical protein
MRNLAPYKDNCELWSLKYLPPPIYYRSIQICIRKFFFIAVQTAVEELLARIQFHALCHGRLHSVSSVVCELQELPCSDSVIELGTESFGG